MSEYVTARLTMSQDEARRILAATAWVWEMRDPAQMTDEERALRSAMRVVHWSVKDALKVKD